MVSKNRVFIEQNCPSAGEDLHLSAKTVSPAETQCRNKILAGIYRRQFSELARLRRHICSFIPFRRFSILVEPGCGTGLLASEITSITDASYTGIDISYNILSIARRNIPERDCLNFVHADALEFLPPADAFLSSFFLADLTDPAAFLRGAADALPPGGFYIVFGEYNYSGIREDPPSGLADKIMESLQRDGLSIDLGGKLDAVFMESGYDTVESGSIRGKMQEPDTDFISLQLGSTDGITDHSRLSWEIVWGIYRTRYSRSIRAGFGTPARIFT